MSAEKNIEILDDARAQARARGPIGSKFLVEVEIVNKDGRYLMEHAMFNKEAMIKFEQLTGCILSIIYNSNVTDVDAPVEVLLEKVTEKVNQLVKMKNDCSSDCGKR